MTHPQESLEALGDRELDTVVAEIVMDWKWFHRIGSYKSEVWLLKPM